MTPLIAKILLFLASLTSISFAMLMAIFTFFYPLSYFKANDISSWIGMPVTLFLFIIGTLIGAVPFTYISHQRKNKIGFFGNLQCVIDASKR